MSPPQSPQQETATPSPSRQALASLPGYQQRTAPPMPSATTRPDPPPADGLSGPASSDQDRPTRTDDDRPFKLTHARTAPYEAVARGALRALGGLLNSRLQADEDDESFLPDHDDEKTVPPPAGRIMARRIPFDISAAELTDLEDIACLGVGLIAWGIKGLTSVYENRRRVRRELAGRRVYDDGAQADGQEPGQ